MESFLHFYNILSAGKTYISPIIMATIWNRKLGIAFHTSSGLHNS